MVLPASTDPGTVGEFFEKYSAAVLRLCRRLSASEQDAEDAHQEAFLQLQRHGSRLDPTGNPVGWLFRTAAHAALKTARCRKSWEPQAGEERSAAPTIIDPEDRESISIALRALPEEYRSLLRMRFHEGRSPADIAKSLGLPRIRIRVQLCRALRLLREIVKGMS